MSKGKTAKGTAIKQINMRRCVACRQVRHKSELLRVAKIAADEFSIDETGKLEGRGAYVCKSPECIATVIKRRNFDKVFKAKVPDDVYNELVATSAKETTQM